MFVCILIEATSCVARTQSLYEYIKVEEYNPRDFTLALLPKSVFPIEKVVKYEKRLNADLTIDLGKSSRTLRRGALLGVEYRVRYQEGQGKQYEPLVYSVDYAETDRGRRTSQVSPSWIKAYEFIKNNTEENALIICWWPHGKRIRLFAGRETLVAGPSRGLIEGLPVQNDKYREATRHYELKWLREKEGLEDDEKLRDVAMMFCSPEAKAIEIMGRHNPMGRPLYVVASAEEFPEMANINHLADGYIKVRKHYIGRIATTVAKDMVILHRWLENQGIESFYVQVYDTYYVLWYLEDQDDPTMQEALLLRLLPLSTGHGQEIGYFTPVFQSPEAHVWVYRFVPEGVPVRRLRREGARHFGAHQH
ncbi:MAG: hypothetical protein ACE5IC_07350 [Candidatus Brocadiales bacterium]